jgi:hypothetical protein
MLSWAGEGLVVLGGRRVKRSTAIAGDSTGRNDERLGRRGTSSVEASTRNLPGAAYLWLIRCTAPARRLDHAAGNPEAPIVLDAVVETLGASGGGFAPARRSRRAAVFGWHGLEG